MIFRDLQHEDGEDISVRMMVTTEEVMAVRLLQTTLIVLVVPAVQSVPNFQRP